MAGASAAGAVGFGALGEALLSSQETPRSRIAALHSTSLQPAVGRLVSEVVLRLLDAGVSHVTGIEAADKAWAKLFAADDVVALKVNTSGGPLLSTSTTIVDAIVQRLADVGISRDNMVVYDRTDGMLQACGYRTNTGSGLKCGGVEGHWDDKVVSQGAFRGRLPVILGLCSAIVNVPILKDAAGAGVTISMKNHFGTISNPSQCHGGGCDPYIADVNALPGIRTKQRLIVCDATSACFEGGPAADPRYIWQPNTLLVGADPVAIDTVGATMIDEKRVQQGFPTLEAAGRKPKQLASAAARGVGTDDLSQIELLKRSL
jgi:uncharacterized protein (DUF362 family)